MTTLKPGRELDAAVAEAIGLVVIRNWPQGTMPDCGNLEAALGKYDEDGNCSAVLAAKEVK